MQEEWWENPTRIVNDYWWIFLILVLLALSGWFSRRYWLPEAPPPPTATATPSRTPSPMPTLTPRPSTTPTPEPTATRVATLGTGDVQVTLLWDSVNDLDLWVTDPAGETIYFDHKYSASNGELDVDANPACNNKTTTPVENIFWPSNGAPRGMYQVSVHFFKVCQPDARTPFTVRLLVNGETQTFEDVAEVENGLMEIATFTIQP